MKQGKGKERPKGFGKRKDSWKCLDCGQPVAPYKAAMDQHKHLNEYCIACQLWNRLSKWEQDNTASWQRCKHQARGIKYGRQTELAEDGYPLPDDDDREASPAVSLRSVNAAGPARKRAQSEMPSASKENQKMKSKIESGKTSPEKGKKKSKKENPDSSSEKPKKKSKKEDRGSSDDSEYKPKSSLASVRTRW